MQRQTLNVYSTERQQALLDYLDTQIQTYYNDVKLSFEFFSDYEPELKIFCDMNVSEIFQNTEMYFNINEFDKNVYMTQSGGSSTIADKIMLLNKMFRSSTSVNLKIESGICELFKKVAKDGEFLEKLTKGIKIGVNAVVNTVETLVQTYNDLPFEKKISGVQNVLKGVLRMIWKKFINIWQIPEFSVSDIRDTHVFFDKLKNFIERNLKIKEDNIGDTKNKPTMLISVADFIGNIIAAFTKNMSDDDEVNDLTFLVDYIAIIKDDATFLVSKNLESINIITQQEYTEHKQKRQLKHRASLLDFRIKQLSKYITQGKTNRNESLLRTIDTLNFVQDIQKSMNQNIKFVTFYNNLVTELIWIIDHIPEYNKNVDLNDVINNKVMKNALNKLNDIAPPNVKLPIPNVFKNVGTQLIRFFSKFVNGGLPDINIPFEELFGLCTFGLSTIFDNLDIFTGGILQLINISLMLLHYVISFNSKQYIKSLGAITGQKTTMNARMKEQGRRMKDNNIQPSKLPSTLPPLVVKRGGTLPPLGSTGRTLPSKNQSVTNTPNTTYSTHDNRTRLENILESNSKTRQNIGLTVSKIKLNDKDEYDVNRVIVTTIQLIKSDLYTVHNSEKINEHNNKIENLVTKYVSENKDIKLDDLSNDIHNQSLNILGEYTTRNYKIPLNKSSLLTLNYRDEFIEFATQSIVEYYIKQYPQKGGNKQTRLSAAKIQEINNYLGKIRKEDLYKYCKFKNIKVSLGMRKNELINCIICNYKQM